MKYRLMHENNGEDRYWLEYQVGDEWWGVKDSMRRTAEEAKAIVLKGSPEKIPMHIVEEFER